MSVVTQGLDERLGKHKIVKHDPSNNNMLTKAKALFSRRNGSFATNTALIADARLRGAAEQFHEFQEKLHYLHNILRTHLQDLHRSSASRALVVQALATVSHGSPMKDLVAGDDASSYTSLQEKAGHEASARLELYEQQIVAYVAEWETTVSTRVASELKHTQNLYRRTEKYRQTVDKKNQSPEKLSWNESKLRTALKEYRRNLIAVTLLTEEVTIRGWKDMVPLMTRMIDLDISSTTSVNAVAKQLSNMRKELISLGQSYEMDFESIRSGRLRVLLEEDAMDFVDPSDLASVEASTVIGAAPPPRLSSTETSSQVEPLESPPREHRPEEPIREEDEFDEKEDAEVVEVKPQYPEDEDEDSVSRLKYPASIYLMPGSKWNCIDDETTLTGTPDLCSV